MITIDNSTGVTSLEMLTLYGEPLLSWISLSWGAINEAVGLSG